MNYMISRSIDGAKEPLCSVREDLDRAFRAWCGRPLQESDADGAEMLWGLTDADEIRAIAADCGLDVPTLPEDGYWIQTLRRGDSPLRVIAGGGLRGLCYGLYEFLRGMQLDQALPPDDLLCVVRPDLEWRMLTEPFDVPGFPDACSLPKPVVARREYDAMKPFRTTGYSPMDEARNLLRAGLNMFWVGNWTFAADYDGWDPSLFPPGSPQRAWQEDYRGWFRENIAAARQMGLMVCVSSDVYVWPKGVDPDRRDELLAYSLGAMLEEFPEIDVVCTRYGENYSFFNPWFEGAGPEGDEVIARVTSAIYRQAVGDFGRRFWCRTWWTGDQNWHARRDCYERIASSIDGGEGLAFSIKNTETDFWRYNRFNPCIGAGRYPQVIEYLCRDSYHLKGSAPYYEGIRMASGARELSPGKGLFHAVARGVKGAWGWLLADGWNGPYARRDEWFKANLYAFSRLCWNSRLDPRDIAREWAALEFGVPRRSEAADVLAGILMDSEQVVLEALYVRSHSLRHTGWIPHENWLRDDLLGGVYESSGDRQREAHRDAFGFEGHVCVPGTIAPLFSADRVDEDCGEKLRAARLADEGLNAYRAIRDALPDRRQAEEIEATLEAWRELIATICHYFCGTFRFLNGETKRAAGHFEQWKEAWDRYRDVCSRGNGAPTPMADGGMERDALDLWARCGAEREMKGALR
jgi:hypothetical protein